MERSSGILLPLFSLPSKYGIGDMGAGAREFIDFLADAGQRWWQLLPLGPAGPGNSPYSPLSSFAGNPLYIDLDGLASEGLLAPEELDLSWGRDARRVDYALLSKVRIPILRKAFTAALKRGKEASQEEFERENASWLCDYALFMAARGHFGGSWPDWPDERLRRHEKDAAERYGGVFHGEIEFRKWLQYRFYKDFQGMKKYAAARGLRVIGDVPFYMPLDSADVWAERRFFKTDLDGRVGEVAGVPPDAFSEKGQLWGNPLYDWEEMRANGYGWWIRRVGWAAKFCDALRLDHFRGFESFWRVPGGSPDASCGRWGKGPGRELTDTLRNWFPNLLMIAEDLGSDMEGAKELLKASGLPGMKVLQFAFDAGGGSEHLPHRHERNCVCYTGTHDNSTLTDWLSSLPKNDLFFAERYLGLNDREGYVEGVLRGGMSSVADLFISCMQDWLKLPSDCRINIPGTKDGNWSWRMLPYDASGGLAAKMRAMTKLFGR